MKLIDKEIFASRMFDELIAPAGLGDTSIKMKIANKSRLSANEIFVQFGDRTGNSDFF